MTREDFFNSVAAAPIDGKKVAQVAACYHSEICGLAGNILSFADQTIFLDNEWRLLSFAEIADASTDLHVDFAALSLLPLFDCGENNFVTYHLKDDTWSYFNITDESVFKQRSSLQELMP